MMMTDINIKHTVCNENCGRWWTTLREALMDGYEGKMKDSDDEIKFTCDYCRSEFHGKEVK